ncbi:YDG domain-containing protein [Pseudoduganella sp. S-14]|uniref:YDG domain-containing protein n=1 Tax=Pseudoduganella sp. S-14 TaxID=3404065 RepID=UPI003CE7C2B1
MHKHASANRFYRLVWSAVHRCWVAVAEGSRSHGKGGVRRRAVAVLAGSLAMAGAANAGAPPANALPNGMQLVAGQAGVNVQGNSMTVSQATQQAIMNWQGFNIGAEAQVRFNQPNASAVALNRVVGGEASAIFGKLSSNGKVFLVNPQGVLFGAGAQVNVGGLVATSLGISDQSFLSGSYNFSGSGTAAVRNEGSINAGGGIVALLAPAVSNTGAIKAHGGSIALAAGNAVGLDFRGDGLIAVRVEKGALDALAENKGLLQADGGQVVLTAKAADALARSTVNNAGLVQARGLLADGGTIRLVGDGQVHAGQLDASATRGQGGRIQVEGGFVALDGAVRSDGARGGAIEVKAERDLSAASALSAAGRDGLGGNISLSSGASLVENSAASADASGTTDGGTVSLRAGGSLLSSGRQAARGVAGKGGRVDISGADVRLMGATVDASGATQGGLVRVGGAFQGGAKRDDAPDADRFTARWGTTAGIGNADATFLNDSTVLDVSARGWAGQGGTAIVWSDRQTTMLGAVKAGGQSRGGAVEISSHEDLRHVGLERLEIGKGGSLLLDPKNIVIGSFANQWTFEAAIGKGFSGGKNQDVAGLNTGDTFGSSVALTSDGKGLAVGAPFDAGIGGAAGVTYGAVRLFTFSDDKFSGGTLAGTIGYGYTGGNNYNLSAKLTGNDSFGTSVALNGAGTVMAVGALGEDLAGKVYTFALGDGFAAPALKQTITAVDPGGNAFGVSVALNGAGDKLAVGALYNNKVELYKATAGTFAYAQSLSGGTAPDVQYGTAVALNDAGTQLAVGAPGENNARGTVYLYTTPFDTPVLAGTIGQDGSKLDIALVEGESFGASLAMNDAGTRLAVGSPSNGGLGSATTGPGAVRVIDYSGNFVSPAVTAVIGREYLQGANASLDIDEFGNFGFAVAMNGAGDAMAIAQPRASAADGNDPWTGALSLFRLLRAPAGGSLAFNQGYPKAGVNAAVDAQKLAAALADGTDITLQANNDITWDAGNAINAAGNGRLTLQAGRSIDLKSDITMGGTLDVVANAGTAAGVVSGYRGAGKAAITVADGTAIRAGEVNMTIHTGAGQANHDSGDITVGGAVSGRRVTVINRGTSAGSDIVINAGGSLAGSAGSGVTVTVAAHGSSGGSFINNAGSSALRGGVNGYYHVYSDTTQNTLEGMSGYSKHYNQAYDNVAPAYTADGGNWFMYKESPTLVVTAQSASRVYDGSAALPAFVNNVKGYIDGDSYDLTGSAGATGFTRNAGTYALNQGDLASKLGYNITFNGGGQLTVTPRQLSVTATGINKVYDGLDSASVTLADNRVVGDQLSATFTSSKFFNKNAGYGKGVTVAGLSLSGADAGNYSLGSTTATTSADITPRMLHVSAAAADKVYDSSVNAIASFSDDRLGSDALAVIYTGAQFTDKNVGAGKGVQVSGLSLSGADAANYVLGSTSASATARITARQLVVGVSVSDKVYDGGVSATATFADDRLGSDVLTVSGNAVFANKNAGAGKTVTASGLLLTGADAGNYSLAAPTASTTAAITARTLHVTATGNNKVYDGTQAATVAFGDDRVAGDVMSIGGNAAFADKSAGNARDVSVTGISLSGGDAGNYVLSSSLAATKADIVRRTLNVSMTGGGKTYDGTTDAAVGLASDALNGDIVSLGSASASFANKDAGSGKTVNVSGVSITGGADAGNYVLASGTVTGIADIAARTLVVTATGVNRVYDGSRTAAVAFGDDRVGGDVLSVNGNAAFADKKVGIAKDVGVSGITLSGTDAGNYVLASGSLATRADIGARTLNATATGVNKVYDQGMAATVTLGDDRVAGDAISLGYGSASFADKNAGTGKAISVSGISIGGADAGNYALASPNAAATGDITARLLAVGTQVSNKVYDGSLSASASFTDNRLAGDQLSVGGNAAFADKNAGSGKTVVVSGLVLSGADAGNYALASNSVSSTADIAARTLNVSAQGSKIYDGGTAVALSFGDDRLAGDVLAIGGRGSFADKNAGNAKALTVAGLALSGSDAGNYQLISTTLAGTGSITPRVLTANVAATDKVYDASTATSVVLLGDDRVAGDQLALAGGIGSFADKNAGSNKAVVLSGLSLGGADAGNYAVSFVANSTASIAPRALVVSAAGLDKVYDGSLAASVTFGDDRLAGDRLQVGGNAGFADKNAGNGKAISVSGISLAGADAGNYVVSNSSATTAASITPKALAAVVNGVAGKAYDGSTSALVAAGQVGLAGFASGEGASVGALQGQYNSANVAGASSVKANLAPGAVNANAGTALSNYVLPADVTLAGRIDPRQVSINGVSVANKAYDGSSNAVLSNAGTLSGLVDGESLSLQGPASVQFDNRNAGAGKQVIASGYRLADGSGQASNYVLADSSLIASGTITQAQLIVKADDQVRAYGASNPSLTWQANGFVGGDTAALLGDVRTSTAAARESAPGGYAIVIEGNSLANYAVNYVNGVMTVKRVPQQIENLVGNTARQSLPGQQGSLGQGAHVWTQLASDSDPLVEAPVAAVDSGGGTATQDKRGWLSDLLQRAKVRAANNAAAATPQNTGETREYTIGGGSRVTVRDGGVNGAGAPN